MSGSAQRPKKRGRDEDGKKDKNSSSIFTDLFCGYKNELNAKYELQERIVKLSRDCTIHSKKAIFILHQYSGSSENKEQVLSEAKAKIDSDVTPVLRSIASVASESDPYKFSRSYSPGVQEFVEALSFYEYLKTGKLISLGEAQKYLAFRCKGAKDELTVDEKEDQCKDDIKEEEQFVLPLTESDFLLGLADLTGELMRLCTDAVGSKNVSLPFLLLPFFRAIYCGFLGVRPDVVRSFGQKRSVMLSSLQKVENICYSLKIRGSEAPEHVLMNVLAAVPMNNDAGDQD